MGITMVISGEDGYEFCVDKIWLVYKLNGAPNLSAFPL